MANIQGGICNGITANETDPSDLEYMPYDVTNYRNWRWIEQWLPHDAWYFLAVSSLKKMQDTPYSSEADCNGEIGGTAYIDYCQNCVGGSTGLSPSFDPTECLTSVNQPDEFKTSVYPNPASTFVHVTSESDGFIQLFSVDQRLLAQQSMTSGENVIDVSVFNTGVYLLVVTHDDGTDVRRIVKE